MSEEQVFKQLEAIVADITGREGLNLDRETVAKNVEGWNSLNHVQIIMSVEREFKIKIALPELMRVQNVGQLVDIIRAKL